ncbi:hypothetical protein [Nocardiopsis sp. CA-288880]|uniref:hypothetical protein n=1 Tax=Nocardiopsis sp. CA-288880 TaxID=3239995 RepID=UPI003D97EBB3
MTISTEPITRHVYMQIAEVLRPHIDPIDITRSDLWTLITIHPGTPTPPGIQEIARRLHDNEVSSWATPWFGEGVDLAAIARDPLRYIAGVNPTILTVPALPHVVPRIQRAPWLSTI